ncbi:unnamed protein product [Debaryomyces tyrocola]|nr:unnamed protein product [Debaryomyces tyrocola]
MFTLRTLKQSAGPIARNVLTRNTINLSIAYRLPKNHIPKQFSNQLLSQSRLYSVLSTSPEAKLYNYENVKEIVKNPSAHPNSLIVDVREPVEYEDGHIPNAINIPFKSSPGALDLSPEEFNDNFGFDKPSKDKELIFYCLAGVRSTAAEELADTFGYKKRGNYVGSYEDWAAKENAKST